MRVVMFLFRELPPCDRDALCSTLDSEQPLRREGPDGTTEKFQLLATTPEVTTDVVSVEKIQSVSEIMRLIPDRCDIALLAGNYMEGMLMRQFGLRLARSLPRLYFENTVLWDGWRVCLDPVGVNSRSSVRSQWEWWCTQFAGDCDLSYYDRYIRFRAKQSRGRVSWQPSSERKLFLPLQWENDSFVRVESKVKHTAQLMALALEFCERACRGDYRLFVKRHPREQRSLSEFVPKDWLSAERIIEVPASISPLECIQACDLTFVNISTVGFEALICRKPVVTLADSSYSGLGFTLDWRDLARIPEPEELETYETTFRSEALQDALSRYLFFMANEYAIDVRKPEAVRAKISAGIEYWHTRFPASGEESSGMISAVRVS